ncbi:MAG: nucleotidyltransferase domain-containing protein [Rhodospirillales bacterium]|nr:nucleotidyltransferase domain-containing protein [Rhodospirillales bacterium]
MIAILREHEAELRRAGVRHLSLFGSFARGDDEPGSDVDLAAELDPEARIGLFALEALERRLAELVGRKVDLLAEPVEKPRPRNKIDRDRRRAFSPRPGRLPGRHHRQPGNRSRVIWPAWT